MSANVFPYSSTSAFILIGIAWAFAIFGTIFQAICTNDIVKETVQDVLLALVLYVPFAFYPILTKTYSLSSINEARPFLSSPRSSWISALSSSSSEGVEGIPHRLPSLRLLRHPDGGELSCRLCYRQYQGNYDLKSKKQLLHFHSVGIKRASSVTGCLFFFSSISLFSGTITMFSAIIFIKNRKWRKQPWKRTRIRARKKTFQKSAEENKAVETAQEKNAKRRRKEPSRKKRPRKPRPSASSMT